MTRLFPQPRQNFLYSLCYSKIFTFPYHRGEKAVLLSWELLDSSMRFWGSHNWEHMSKKARRRQVIWQAKKTKVTLKVQWMHLYLISSMKTVWWCIYLHDDSSWSAPRVQEDFICTSQESSRAALRSINEYHVLATTSSVNYHTISGTWHLNKYLIKLEQSKSMFDKKNPSQY